jgi:hypothetical protein
VVSGMTSCCLSPSGLWSPAKEHNVMANRRSQHYDYLVTKFNDITVLLHTRRSSTLRPAIMRCSVVLDSPYCNQSLYLYRHSLEELTKIMKHLRWNILRVQHKDFHDSSHDTSVLGIISTKYSQYRGARVAQSV